jgi:hypothetical protein
LVCCSSTVGGEGTTGAADRTTLGSTGTTEDLPPTDVLVTAIDVDEGRTPFPPITVDLDGAAGVEWLRLNDWKNALRPFAGGGAWVGVGCRDVPADEVDFVVVVVVVGSFLIPPEARPKSSVVIALLFPPS